MPPQKTIYKKLARVLDTLPNGYPETESGVESVLSVSQYKLQKLT